MRSGVMGSCSSLAPVASNTAFAINPPLQMMAGSPPPCAPDSCASRITVSISGNQEKRFGMQQRRFTFKSVANYFLPPAVAGQGWRSCSLR